MNEEQMNGQQNNKEQIDEQQNNKEQMNGQKNNEEQIYERKSKKQCTGIVMAVCISEAKGTEKRNVGQARLIQNYGLEADAHAGNWHRQVSLLSYEQVQAFNDRGGQAQAGAFGENLLVQGIDFRQLPVGTRFFCGDVILKLTQVGKECHSHCEIFKRVGDCIMPREGVFATVERGGSVQVGDRMNYELPAADAPMTAAVVTLSDQGAAGKRKDLSGPRITELLTAAGYEVIEQILLPDDRKKLEHELIRLADSRQADLIMTTGGTGFSMRDVTPEATLAVADRNAPGIAEAIRAGSMQITKRAMLSRGASVIRKRTLIVNLPGSPKAVEESLEIILPELAHGIRVLKGSATECAGER